MDRLKKLRIVDPVLTKLTRGYRNAQFIGEFLFPLVTVDQEGVIIPLFGKDSFKVYDTERAVRAASNVMVPNGASELDVVLREHDLAYPIDYREQAESMFDEESKAARATQDAISLRREIACASLAQSPATYLAGAKVTLAGPAKWAAGGGDPVADIEAGKEVVRSRIGRRPNTITMGAAAYQALKFHPKLQAALGANEQKLITLEHLRALLGVDDIYIGEALAGATNTADVWGDNVVLAYVAKPAADRKSDYDEPSFGYTLRRKGMPEVDKYPGMGGKVQFVRFTDIYKPVVVGADAGYLISDLV